MPCCQFSVLENDLDVANFLHIQLTMSDESERVGRECVGFRARMVSRVITAVFDDAFSDVGLKSSQFSVLNRVARQEEIVPSELAKVLHMDESTVSRNVERMCARGWLRLESGDGDRRSHRITLTDKGKALLRKAYPAWEKAQAEVARRLGPDGVAALRSVVRKLRVA